MFAFQYNPVYILENGSLAIAYGNMLEHNDHLGYWGEGCFMLHLDGMRAMLNLKIGLDLNLRNKVKII